MDRLTERSNGVVILNKQNCEYRDCNCCPESEKRELCKAQAAVYSRLAAYEDTGIAPEQIEVMQGHNIALINQLKEYQDTGLEPEEIPHWIPVSEPPKKSEYREKDTGELIPLLVCIKGTKYPFRAMYDGKSWGDGLSKLNVTYWMPLPQPPKGEK